MAFPVAGEKDEVTRDEKHSYTDSESISFSDLLERQLATGKTF